MDKLLSFFDGDWVMDTQSPDMICGHYNEDKTITIQFTKALPKEFVIAQMAGNVRGDRIVWSVAAYTDAEPPFIIFIPNRSHLPKVMFRAVDFEHFKVVEDQAKSTLAKIEELIGNGEIYFVRGVKFRTNFWEIHDSVLVRPGLSGMVCRYKAKIWSKLCNVYAKCKPIIDDENYKVLKIRDGGVLQMWKTDDVILYTYGEQQDIRNTLEVVT